MNADDHQLLEQTRRANKVLSLFVFALQEEAAITAENQHEIADTLETLAETIRARWTSQPTNGLRQLLVVGEVEDRPKPQGDPPAAS